MYWKREKANKKMRLYFNIPSYELKFPLNGPKYDVEDLMYYDKVQKKFKLNIFDKIELSISKLNFEPGLLLSKNF